MNIADAITNNAARRPDHPAIVAGDRTLSYAAFDAAMRGWAAHLGERGVRPGDIVGVNLKDTAEHLIALYAIARLGAAILPMDWRWTDAEKARLTGFFKARLVLCEPDDAVAPDGDGWVKATVDDAWNEAVANADTGREFPAGGNPPLVLSLSSGTTGTPKGPLITHDHMFARFMIYFMTLGFNERTRFLCATPLYFGGSRGYTMCSLYAGATVLMHPLPYEIADLVAAAGRQRATKLFLVPTLIRRLLQLEPPDGRPPPEGGVLLPGIDCLFSTGAVLHAEERAALLSRVCPNYINFYGSTDGGGATALLPDDPDRFATSVGRPVFGISLEIAGDDHAKLPAGEIGRIRFRGRGTAAAYYNDPEASKAAFHDGWYYPGDLGWRDADGYLHLAGRATDMIIRGGVNIYPAEIEHALILHPAVREAAVLGRPSRELGEEVAAFVVPADGASPDTAALAEHCRAMLAPYKVPRDIIVVEDLPKSGVGKVLKSELAARLTPL